MSDWYYSLLGEEFGPVSVATLHELLQDGTLAGSDPVRRSDAAEPITGTEFQRLNPLTANLPPKAQKTKPPMQKSPVTSSGFSWKASRWDRCPDIH